MCRVSLHTRLKYLLGFITRCAIEACVQQFEHNDDNVAKRHKMYQSEKPNGQICFLSAPAVAQESLCSSIIWPFISGPFVKGSKELQQHQHTSLLISSKTAGKAVVRWLCSFETTVQKEFMLFNFDFSILTLPSRLLFDSLSFIEKNFYTSLGVNQRVCLETMPTSQKGILSRLVDIFLWFQNSIWFLSFTPMTTLAFVELRSVFGAKFVVSKFLHSSNHLISILHST